jgi:hypothetical protein
MASTHPGLHHAAAPRARAAFLIFTFTVAVAGLALAARDAAAGCGCKKPPPPLAYLRPHFTYAGTPLDLFHADLVEGAAYRVRFASPSGDVASVVGTGFDRRDLADGQVKTHLRVTVPNLPLGPAAIEVFDEKERLVLAVGDDDFTVVPSPVVLSDKPGVKKYDGQRAAIGRDGTVYLSIDLSAVKQAATLDIRGKDLPLSFDALGVSFHNTQGFLMQLLDKPVAGMVTFDVAEGGKKDSTRLRYFRHEFETYFLAHGERETHAIDPTDPSWHLDGTPHIDHDRLIVAIRGLWKDGVARAPGATEPFTLFLNPLPDDAAPLP